MTAPIFTSSFLKDLDRLFVWRRDVRHFRSSPVPDTVLNALLYKTCLAPSVGLSEPWRFVLVETPERKEAMKQNFIESNARDLDGRCGEEAKHYATLKLSGMDEAPHHIAVFCDINPTQGRGLGRASMPETTTWSAVMAIHTFWLAATARGIGVGWVSILDPELACRTLSVSPKWRFLAYLCVGYPQEAVSTPELERLGWERRNPNRRKWIYR